MMKKHYSHYTLDMMTTIYGTFYCDLSSITLQSIEAVGENDYLRRGRNPFLLDEDDESIR